VEMTDSYDVQVFYPPPDPPRQENMAAKPWRSVSRLV
jgi:hypothetical protein